MPDMMTDRDWLALSAEVRPVVGALMPRAEVDDIVQETMLQLQRRVAPVPGKGPEDLAQYAKQLARNLCSRWHRERLRHPPPSPLHANVPGAVWRQTLHSRRFLLGPFRAILAVVLSDEFGTRDRKVLARILLHGCSIRKTAANLGLSRLQVRRSIARIIALVQAEIDKPYPPPH